MERKDNCRYCGRGGAHGYSCMYSPWQIHVEEGDADHCIFCGSTNYGQGCSYSHIAFPSTTNHKHGHGNRDGKARCVWCGSEPNSNPCSYSPNKKHEY